MSYFSFSVFLIKQFSLHFYIGYKYWNMAANSSLEDPGKLIVMLHKPVTWIADPFLPQLKLQGKHTEI